MLLHINFYRSSLYCHTSLLSLQMSLWKRFSLLFALLCVMLTWNKCTLIDFHIWPNETILIYFYTAIHFAVRLCVLIHIMLLTVPQINNFIDAFVCWMSQFYICWPIVMHWLWRLWSRESITAIWEEFIYTRIFHSYQNVKHLLILLHLEFQWHY